MSGSPFDDDAERDPAAERLRDVFAVKAPGREDEAAKHWHSDVGEMTRYGAIEAPSLLPGLVIADTAALFGDGALAHAKHYVLSLGLSDLLLPEELAKLSTLALERLVCARVGAERPDARDYVLAETAAFFVVAFLQLHAAVIGDGSPVQVAERRERGEGFWRVLPPDRARMESFIRLGRLLEWWRWRSEGHDRRAATRHKAERAYADDGGGRAGRNLRRKAAADPWRSAALTSAAERWARDPAAKVSHVARGVLSDLKARGVTSADGKAPGLDSVRKLIGKHRPERCP